ncbi:ABC transporter-like protein [Cordyceps fumosorosea ARSEF 2679]|uniref:ABC transporter-like protein n=1 Tax=Cordyceps fumosorosea (strain ARSEF 2679) TaxID=1081104 RepID=A0A167NLF7_CORFA|nr:ABC transporter-like protein [Cordyceps fumosorosea ARSEF 2679]OAA55687.1 ABC transporter-like protein [Cordyceps fumosorosea ARSEF 2679]
MAPRASYPLRLLGGLVRKNTLNHIVRHPISFLLTFYAIPLVLLPLLLSIPKLAVVNQVSGAADPAPIRPLSADTLPSKLVVVRPADLGADVQRVIDTFTKPLRPDQVQIVPTDEALFKTCSQQDACTAAVSFYDSPDTASKNKTWQYAIRSDAKTPTQEEYIAHRGAADDVLLPLQLAVNNAIANTTAVPETFMFARTKSSTDAARKDDAATLVGSVFTFALFACSFFVMIYKPTSWITQDREGGMSRLMDTMGGSWCLPLRVLGWVLVVDLACLPLFVVFGVMYARLAFPASAVAPLIGWQVLLGLAVNSSATFAAAFFTRARVSSIYVAGVFVILSLTMQLIMVRAQPTPLPDVIWALAGLFPSCNHALFTKQMAYWQLAGVPADFSRFPPGSDSQAAMMDLGVVTQNTQLLLLAAQAAGYAVLAVAAEWLLHGVTVRGRTFRPSAADKVDEPSVRVEDLKKTFRPGFWKWLCCCGRRGYKTAIKSVTFEAYPDQILCLAGPNGCGKTTTLQAIAGFSRPSGGRISLAARREEVGICPQQNTLWGDLTVREHVRLWSQIKGGHETEAQIEELIDACDLSRKRDARSTTLSGGQKRKLQLACMFVGGSRVCLIDECTSGLDPLSRRAIWELLLRYRTGRTMVFTTHFLDEVDVLADRIVVVDGGAVRCQGSPAELNAEHGSGYRVVVPDVPGGRTLPFASGAPWQSTTTTHQGQIVTTVPDSETAARLARVYAENGVTDISVAGSQFEDVFLNLVGKPDTLESINSNSNLLADDKGFALSPARNTSFTRQMRVLLGKRFLVLPRLWWPYLLAVLVPVCAALAMVIISASYDVPKCADARPVLGTAEAETFFFPAMCATPDTTCNRMVLAPQDAGKTLRTLVEKPLDELRDVNSTVFDSFVEVLDGRQSWLDYVQKNRDTSTYSGIYMGSGSEAPIIAYRPKSDSRISSFEMLNLWSEMSSNMPIKASFGKIQTVKAYDHTVAVMYCIFLGLVLCIFPPAFVLYPAIEKASKTRSMQYANGVSPGPLVIAYLLFDAIFITLIAIILAPIISGPIQAWIGSGALLGVALVFYGMATVLVGHIVTHFSVGPLKAFMAAFGANLAMFAVAAGAYMSATLSSEKAATSVAFGLGLFFPIGNIFRVMLIGLNVANQGCTADFTPKPSSAMTGYSGPIFYLLLQIIALAAVAIWLDGGLSLSPASLIRPRKTPSSSDMDIEMREPSMPGSGVAAEILRAERDTADMLRALHVTKTFKSNTALDDVTFGLPGGSVLALIGPNGAGKSTLVNVIQGELAASRGAVLLRGDDSRAPAAKRHIGVCPQHDALDLLTTRQHLVFYARVRGVPDVASNVDYLLRRLDLEPHAATPAAKLSGGNKRKLSLAVALMGTPPVLVLDEPTTAMDAVAKRVFWDLVRKVTEGRSILLTTHSMEEADALADRAVILATRVLDIGTTQELRARHGTQSHVNVQLRSAPRTEEREMDRVWGRIRLGVPGASLERDMSRGQIRFTVPLGGGEASGLTVIRITEFLEGCKEELGIAHFNVGGATLEGAFLNIIRANNFQEDKDAR